MLFNDTIYYNIQYGRLDATREEVEDAARQVGCVLRQVSFSGEGATLAWHLCVGLKECPARGGGGRGVPGGLTTVAVLPAWAALGMRPSEWRRAARCCT